MTKKKNPTVDTTDLDDTVDTATPDEPGTVIAAQDERVETVGLAPPEPAQKPAPRMNEEQWAELRTASTEAIRAALDNTEKPLRPEARGPFEGELKRRAELEEAAKHPEPAGLYRVTHDCLIVRDGMHCKVAEGSVVSAATHDLDMLERHGAKLESVDGRLAVQYDQFGRQQTVVR